MPTARNNRPASPRPARTRAPLPAPALDGWRARIDTLDAELLTLLAQRTRLSVQVARWKRASGVPLRTPAREALIIARARHRAPAPLTAAAAARIFRIILAEMRALQARHTRAARP